MALRGPGAGDTGDGNEPPEVNSTQVDLERLTGRKMWSSRDPLPGMSRPVGPTHGFRVFALSIRLPQSRRGLRISAT